MELWPICRCDFGLVGCGGTNVTVNTKWSREDLATFQYKEMFGIEECKWSQFHHTCSCYINHENHVVIIEFSRFESSSPLVETFHMLLKEINVPNPVGKSAITVLIHDMTMLCIKRKSPSWGGFLLTFFKYVLGRKVIKQIKLHAYFKHKVW